MLSACFLSFSGFYLANVLTVLCLHLLMCLCSPGQYDPQDIELMLEVCGINK